MSASQRPSKRQGSTAGPSTSFNGPPVRKRRGFVPQDVSVLQYDFFGRVLPNYVDSGDCSNVCPTCSALYWKSEGVGRHRKYKRCCKSGSVVLPLPLSPPSPLLQLYTTSQFKENIRAYNLMFSMTSFGATVDEKINNGQGPYVFKVNGQICHRLGSLCPQPSDSPRFLQLYIYDTDNEIANRVNVFRSEERPPLSTDIVGMLSKLLNETNSLVRMFKTAFDTASTSHMDEFSVRLYAKSDDRRYDAPVPGSLGAIVSADDESSNEYDIIIKSRSGKPRRVSKLHQSYMALQYPLLFPFGEPGWFPDMNLINEDGSDGRALTITTFYCSQFHDRLGVVSLLLMAGKLLQQYLVDAYLCVEHTRLEYIRKNQTTLRREFVSGIHDAIARGDVEGRSIGQRTFLPSSFVGGPRYMYQHYQDALAICRVHGNPQYFITFTCNVSWPEISRHMETCQISGAQNRPDIIARVFRLKVAEFITFLKQDKTFGDVAAYLYTIEFQKRGLPHCHTLLWVTSNHKIKTPLDVDRHICAELPDPITHPIVHSVVTNCMLHGPCGIFNPKSPCMRNGKCKFSYPKPFNEVTSIDSNGYVRYRRRPGVFHEHANGLRIHSDFVVPYNYRLLSRFRAHINVEYCGWNMMVKYLFKYISKGADRIAYSIKKNSDTASTSEAPSPEGVDEVQKFVDGRYICPHEAAWRIFKFPIHERHPAVQILAVHLPGMQPATFTDSTSLPNLVARSNFGQTTLTSWFNINASDANGRQLTYMDYPSSYWWSSRSKSWVRRTYMARGTIGRLVYIPSTAGELFYLRLLLCHRKGCTSFIDLRTVNGVTYPTFFLACEAMDLIGDDREWQSAFNEAASWATSAQLRSLFCSLLTHCDVSNSMLLWEQGWRRMTEDIAYDISNSPDFHSDTVDDALLQQQLLIEIEILLESASPPRGLSEFRLPERDSSSTSFIRKRLLFEELSYNRQLLTEQHLHMLSKLNPDQLSIYNTVTSDHLNEKQTLMFVYGHGGTGKTFLWSTILAYYRSVGNVALAVAGSGIASLLLPSGRTAHSRFHIPLKIASHTTCGIKKGTQIAELLALTKIIIWDEATMTDRQCFECVDRSFRDILDQPNLPFGGISLLLGGDFRQTLPIKPRKGASEVIASTLPCSYLWPFFQVRHLRYNMRLGSLNSESTMFASWLLSVGNGEIGVPVAGNSTDRRLIKIPSKLLIQDPNDPLQQLISFVYPPGLLQRPNVEALSTRAIVCPKNKTTQEINDRVLNMASGDSRVYQSIDSVQSRTSKHTDLDLLYPPDYLHELMFTGFPISKLELKINSPIILLRNINIREGLCNGTRLVVLGLLTHLIEAVIMTGTAIGTKVLIPKIKFVHDEDDIPFIFIRKQFPVRVCYAMTINKSQGQSLEKVGIYLPQPVFGHGHLYVALSRATSIDAIKILILADDGSLSDSTINVVYKDLLTSINSIQEIQMTRISEIDFECEGHPLQIRVLRKWRTEIRSYETWYLIVDTHGDTIQVLAAGTDAQKYLDHKFKVSHCYEISDYSSADANEHQKMIQKDIYLNIGPACNIVDLPDLSTIPKFSFHFETPDYLRSLLGKKIGFPDFIGVFQGITDKTSVTNEGYNTLTLQDTEGEIVEITLWKECVSCDEKFNRTLFTYPPPHKTVAVTNVKTTLFNYGPKFTSSPATHVYINPSVPESESLLHRINTGLIASSVAQHAITTLEDLATKTHLNAAGKNFVVKCYMKEFKLSESWYNAVCPTCKNLVFRRRQQWFCATHGVMSNVKVTYNVTAEIYDNTSSRNVITPDSFVAKITGITCNQLFNETSSPNRKLIPPQLKEATNKQYLLHLQLAKKSTQANVVYAAIDFTSPRVEPSHLTLSTPPPLMSLTDTPETQTSTSTKSDNTTETTAKRQLHYKDTDDAEDLSLLNPTKKQRYHD